MSSFKDYFFINLGHKIRKYREERGITQEQLAEILDLNDKYIGHVERYERQISLRVAIRLMELWKIKPEEFFSFEESFEWK